MIGLVLAVVMAATASPPLPVILDHAAAAWPEQPGKARRVAVCEMGADVTTGAYPADLVFDLERRYAGPMQIGQPWAKHFAARWTWAEIVRDLEIHFAAAREIYDLAGDWSPWPYCGRLN
jgi:hypothetical protein